VGIKEEDQTTAYDTSIELTNEFGDTSVLDRYISDELAQEEDATSYDDFFQSAQEEDAKSYDDISLCMMRVFQV
jgi:hypothetical protein